MRTSDHETKDDEVGGEQGCPWWGVYYVYIYIYVYIDIYIQLPKKQTAYVKENTLNGIEL